MEIRRKILPLSLLGLVMGVLFAKSLPVVLWEGYKPSPVLDNWFYICCLVFATVATFYLEGTNTCPCWQENVSFGTGWFLGMATMRSFDFGLRSGLLFAGWIISAVIIGDIVGEWSSRIPNPDRVSRSRPGLKTSSERRCEK